MAASVYVNTSTIAPVIKVGGVCYEFSRPSEHAVDTSTFDELESCEQCPGICGTPTFTSDDTNLTLNVSGGDFSSASIECKGNHIDKYDWDPESLPPDYFCAYVRWDSFNCWVAQVCNEECEAIVFGGDPTAGLNPDGLPNAWIVTSNPDECEPPDISVTKGS